MFPGLFQVLAAWALELHRLAEGEPNSVTFGVAFDLRHNTNGAAHSTDVAARQAASVGCYSSVLPLTCDVGGCSTLRSAL
jgi:hypothetical protein